MSKVQFELEKTIYLMDQLTEMPAPQVAMAGRSNVGKSSLINSLAGRKKLAKISSSPGKTRSLNFYRVTPGDFYLVDLPGYGYARTSKSERAQWGQVIDSYVQGNTWLKAVAVLLDSRHSPQKIDLELVTYLQGIGMTIIPIMTKADKTKQRDREQIRKQWAALLDGQKPLVTSAETGLGMDAAWAALRAVVTE